MKTIQGMVSSRFSLLFGLLFLLGLTACGSAPAPQAGKTVIHYNPTDSALITSQDPNGIAVLGKRDADGLPIQISDVFMPSEVAQSQDHAYLDDDGRVTKVVLASGESATFEYVSSTRAVMTVRVGKESERVPLELTPSALRQSAQAVGPQASVTLKGRLEARCGTSLLNADVAGSFKPSVADIKDKGQPLAFTQLSRGIWEYTLPNLPAPPKTPQGLEAQLGAISSLLDELCGAGITNLIDSTIPIGTNDGITEGAKQFCQNYLTSTNPKNACQKLIKLIKKLCKVRNELLNAVDIIYSDAYYTEYTVLMHVSFSAENVKYLPNLTVKVSDTNIPTQVATLPPDPNPIFESLSANPPDPGPKQGYTVTAVPLCAAVGVQVQISVSGTDNYKNSITVTISAGSPSASLYVPGGGASVVDTIKVKVLPNGVEETLVIVF
ncbi:MAG: hypothetical protein SFU83_15280 [Meiothermus sp.]|nr:hypothetical protein [Meiothermus sp.]